MIPKNNDIVLYDFVKDGDGYYSFSSNGRYDTFSFVMLTFKEAIGCVLIFIGCFFRFCAIYASGYNCFYCVDMAIKVPNDYFIATGIYRYFASPTTGIARVFSVGFWLTVHHDSIRLALLCGLVVDWIAMGLIFDACYEQPHVRKMYMGKDEDGDTEKK